MKQLILAVVVSAAVLSAGACGSSGSSVCAQACEKLQDCGLCVATAGQCIPQDECVQGCESQGWQQEAQCAVNVAGCDINALQACVDGTQPYAASGPASGPLNELKGRVDEAGFLVVALTYSSLAYAPEPVSFDLVDGSESLLQVFAVEGSPFLRSGDRVEPLLPDVEYQVVIDSQRLVIRSPHADAVFERSLSLEGDVAIRHSSRVVVTGIRGELHPAPE